MQNCNRSRSAMIADLSERQIKADSLIGHGDYQNAMKAYIDILRDAEKTENNAAAAEALNKIGTIYAYHDDHRKALFYYERSFDLSNLSHDTLGMYKIAANLIMINKVLGDKEKEDYYTRIYKDLKISDNIDYQYNLLYITFLNCLEEGNDEKAKSLLSKIVTFIDDKNYGEQTKGILYNHLGMRYVEKAQYDSALIYYRKAACILDSSSFFSNRQAVYGNMCALFNRLGEQDSLTFYRGKMIESTDSVFDLRNFSDVKNRLDSYENEMTENKIEAFKTRIYLISTIGIVILIILLIILFYSKKINKARLVMVRLNESLLNENRRLREKVEAFSAVKKQEITMQPVETIGVGTQEDKVKEEDKNTTETEGEETAKKTIISSELMNSLSTKILEIMNDKHSVFNSDYNISTLALQLNTNTRYVSEVIKHLGSSNFRNFINEYRIREACQRLSDKENYGKFTIGAIAEGVGFNSDNSFIIAFKKVMGMTPAKYRQLASDVRKENSFQKPE